MALVLWRRSGGSAGLLIDVLMVVGSVPDASAVLVGTCWGTGEVEI